MLRRGWWRVTRPAWLNGCTARCWLTTRLLLQLLCDIKHFMSAAARDLAKKGANRGVGVWEACAGVDLRLWSKSSTILFVVLK